MASEAPVEKKRSSVTKDGLQKRASQLKHVTTREYADGPTAEEVEVIKKIWDEKHTNPQVLAEHFEIDHTVLRDNMPSGVEEFTKNLFQGLYTLDKNEAAKDRLRERLAIDLKRSAGKLRKSVTKEYTGPTNEDLAAAAKIWEECKGNVDVVAEKLGVKVEFLKQDPPFNAAEFGEKLLAGNYTPNADEAAKSQLRETLRQGINQRRTSLKKTLTKEGAGLDAEDPMFTFAAKMYPGRNAKEIDAVAEKYGLSAAHMKSNPGENNQDFARKLLGGAYTPDADEAAKKALRSKLEAAIKERRPSLKPTTTRRMSNVSDEEFTNFSAFYTKKGGDLQAIATESGIPIQALQANPPANAADFVLKLLTGAYTIEMNEQAKATLRACMRQEMRRTSSALKRTSTKEWDGKVDEADVKLVASAYTSAKGDVKYLATTFNLSLEAMTSKPPKDANEFAQNVLLGKYTTA